MKIVLAISIVVVVVAAALVWWLGSRAPARHRASVEMTLRESVEEVYDTVSDVADAPAWRKDVKRIEFLEPAADGSRRFRDVGANGTIVYTIESAQKPGLFVTRIDDAALPFGGTWTISITPENGGSRIRIVEDGEVRSTLFRFVAHYLLGYEKTLRGYLSALAEKFGETPEIRSASPR